MSVELSIKDDCSEIIAQRAQDGLKVRQDFFDIFAEDIQEAGKLLALACAGEQRILTLGLGASAALAQILAGRLVNANPTDRSALPAMALANTLAGCEECDESQRNRLFSRQLEVLGADGDILIIFTCEGKHPALVEAARTAHEQGMFILGLTGGDGGLLASEDLLDLELRVPSIEEALIHEIHASLACLLDELANYYLFIKPEILSEMLQAGVSRLKEELGGE